MSEGTRNRVFDAIKALAIVLVVYAHSIQYLSGCDFWNNGIFQLIYSFHMPLFFMVSGFFISSSLQLGWKDFLLKKCIALLLPCFVWTIIFSCVQFPGWHKMLVTIVNPLNWKLWFLKGLFLTQLVLYACVRVGARGGG
jgi:fucose 4-O-acetylase-like acetyltransferase